MKRAAWRAAWAGAFIVAVVFYYALSRRFWGGNSDVATPLLQAQAVAQGHPTLDGWAFLLDSFWTVDVPIYTVGYLVRGIDPQLMFIVPAIVAAAIVSVGLYLTIAGRSRAVGWISAVTLVALIALPTQLWTFMFVSLYGHPTTLLFCLVAFVALRSSTFGWRWFAAVLLLALGLLGDLQALPLGAGPVLGAGIIAMLRKRSTAAGLPAVSAALAAPVLAFGIRRLAVLVGTYDIGDANPVASAGQRRSNVSLLPHIVDGVFGSGTERTSNPPHSDLLGRLIQDADIRSIATVVVVAVVALTIVAMTYRALAGIDRSRGEHQEHDDEWRIDDMLAIACVGSLALFIFAALDGDAASPRYVTAFVLFGSILTARRLGVFISALPRAKAVRLPVYVAGVLLTVSFAAASLSGLDKPTVPLANSELADFLVAQDLHVGVGPYWQANQTTVASGGDVVVRPIKRHAHELAPRKQLARDTWYHESFEFLICPTVGEFEGVSCAFAVRKLGEPAQRFTVGPDEVLVWPNKFSVGP